MTFRKYCKQCETMFRPSSPKTHLCNYCRKLNFEIGQERRKLNHIKRKLGELNKIQKELTRGAKNES